MVASATHVCSSTDVDETVDITHLDTSHEVAMLGDVRSAVMGIWSNVMTAQAIVMIAKGGDPERPLSERNRKLSIDTMRMFLMYAVQHCSRRRRTPVDIDAMIEKWVPIIRGLSTAHDKATVDQCEFDSEEHLLPLTSAPVAQLREFYKRLCERLEADPTIPFFVWRSFRTWGDVILDKLPDKGVKQLRGDLAKRVADLVEKDVTPDLNAALVGALQWRDAETLQQIETAVKGGARPRMRGRESCLFLQVETPDERVLHTVML